MRFVNRVKETFRQVFEDMTVFEYVLWWIVRIMLLCAVIFAENNAYRLLDSINMLAAYAMSIIRFIAPRKSFIARLDFRVQHLINIMELLGTFFGHLLKAYSVVPKYDRYLHFLSGPLVLIGGYYIYKAFETKHGKENYRPNPSTATFAATGFSFMVIALWEIQEFVSDFFLGSQNQGFYYAPFDDDIWYKIFGYGAGNEGQLPLWDTMMDMIDATLTTAIAAAVLYFVLYFLNKKRDQKAISAVTEEKALNKC